jgi:hypothetical protein
MSRLNVDDSRLIDELESEIDWDGSHCANGDLDLRLNERQRDRRRLRLPEHLRIEADMACAPVDDPRLAKLETLGNSLDERRDLESQASWPKRKPIGHRFRPIAVALEVLVALADERRKAGGEEVERYFATKAPRLFSELGHESRDTFNAKAEKTRKDTAAIDERLKPGAGSWIASYR